MHTLLEIHATRHFPCPVCGEALDVRESKKDKPYVVCDACGVQMFVRNEAGIRRLEQLVQAAKTQHVWERLKELLHRYQKTCPQCANKFWVTEETRHTDWLNELDGYTCPECGAINKLESGST